MFKGMRDVMIIGSVLFFVILLLEFNIFFHDLGATPKIIILCYISHLLIKLFSDKE